MQTFNLPRKFTGKLSTPLASLNVNLHHHLPANALSFGFFVTARSFSPDASTSKISVATWHAGLIIRTNWKQPAVSCLTGSFFSSLKAGSCVLSDRFSFQQLSLQVVFLWPPEVFWCQTQAPPRFPWRRGTRVSSSGPIESSRRCLFWTVFSSSLKAGNCVLSDRFSFQQLSFQVVFLWPPKVFAARRKHLQDFRGDVARGFHHPAQLKAADGVFSERFFSSSLKAGNCVLSDRFSFQQLSFQVVFLWPPKVFAARRKHLQDFRGARVSSSGPIESSRRCLFWTVFFPAV